LSDARALGGQDSAQLPLTRVGSSNGVELFRNLRTPGVGETMVIEANQFLDRSLKNGIARGVSEDGL
jgi:hypothetical protein